MPGAEVQVKKGEPIERALKRLKNKLESEGIIEEMRRIRAFETPAERTRRKARAAAKRSRNRQRFTLNPPTPPGSPPPSAGSGSSSSSGQASADSNA